MKGLRSLAAVRRYDHHTKFCALPLTDRPTTLEGGGGTIRSTTQSCHIVPLRDEADLGGRSHRPLFGVGCVLSDFLANSVLLSRCNRRADRCSPSSGLLEGRIAHSDPDRILNARAHPLAAWPAGLRHR